MTTEIRPALHFDDRHITWRHFSGYEGLSFWVCGVNDTRQTVDLFFRLAPGARCPSHHHVGPTDTLVIEGEHQTFAPTADGWELDQVRPPGYFAANEGDHLHSEAVGSWGGRRPSMGGHVTGPGATRGPTAVGGRSCRLSARRAARPCPGPRY